MDENKQKNKDKKQKIKVPTNNIFRGLIFWIIIGIILFSLLRFSEYEGAKKNLIYSDFIKQVESQNINGTLKIKNGYIYGELKDGTKFYTYCGEDNELYKILRENNVSFAPEPSSSFWSNLFISVIPVIFLFLLMWFILFKQVSTEGNRVMSFAKSRPIMPDNKNRITFDDVAGCEEAKEDLKEIIEFLKNPKKFVRLGAKIPRGVLLIGAPGTGKTLLAKAVAGEARVPFLSMSGSDFVEMFVGVGASICGDEMVLIKENNQVKLQPISKVVDKYYRKKGEGYPVAVSNLETLGFYKGTTNFWGFKNNLDKFYFGGAKWSKIKSVYRHKVEEIYEIHYLGGKIKTTGDHSVFVREKNYIVAKQVRDLKEGDILVNIPFKVRSSFIPNYGTTHKIMSHKFEKCEIEKISLWENDKKIEENYQFIMENKGKIPQGQLAKRTGVSQTTISNWQMKKYSPASLSLVLNTSRRKIPKQIEITPSLLLLLGYYTAEGRTTPYYVQFIFGSHEKALHKDTINLMKDIFNVDPHLEYTSDNTLRITYHSKILSEFFEKTCGNGSHNKHIPEFLWKLPKEYFLNYLKGFSKGDGYISKKGNLSMSTVSKQLALEISWLSSMHSIGVSCYKRKNKEGRVIKNKPITCGSYWTIKISKTSSPFNEHNQSSFQFKKPIVKKIVKKHYDGFVYDFCGCDNEGFFAGNKPILVHNSRVRDLFRQAKKMAPCIIFIDEIDAVGRQRFAGLGGGHDEREQTLNQLLVEMDGFQTDEHIIVMAATNRPDVLDPALTRPGRFDRTVVVDMPDIRARELIFKVHTKNKPLDETVDLKILARSTAGLSGADIANIVNEAALIAARKGKGKIDMNDFEEARDKVLMGAERKNLVISDEERKIIAYHEAGHTLLQKSLPEVYPVHKVTIIPRGRALGLTHILPDQDKFIQSDIYYKNSLCTLLAGRATEKLIFGKMFTGSENDLKVATEIARRMVCEWGMSEKLGPVIFRHDGNVFLGRDLVQMREHSEVTTREIDEEIKRILEEAENKAINILTENLDKLHKLANALLERETLKSEEIDEILGIEKQEQKGENDGQKENREGSETNS